ncbi:DUF305 domain-containing protein [Deinococcus aerophilus]|uniref:DUF305 domain-containing protein n=1 Tax=Deinococcus aerophilus TaxID=522488 RepID=A0ABQ2GZJ6_9DEIO|nr:DUF305 domain-containing protein [Deinococcus aerophilus]GGM19489.1 hypothetical protein GCM10010841_29420 [Deinococcus aerophilus]
MRNAVLLLTLFLTPLAHAQTSMPGMHHGAPAHHGTTTNGGLEPLKGKAFDRAFLSMMIVHHQGALDMSRAVLNNVKDPQVKKWTADIIRVQQKELGVMNTWLGTLGGVDKGAQTGMHTEMKGMMTALKANKDSDRALVEGMLPHHASAVDMANLALQRSSDARVLGLARDIIRTQADEMYAYRQWLIKRGL